MRRRTLRDRNIVPLEMTGRELIETLKTLFGGGAPSRGSIVRTRYPHQFSANEPDPTYWRQQFLQQFDLVRPDALPGPPSARRSLFYMGAEPTWSDIGAGVDATRSFVRDFVETLVASPAGLSCFLLTGYAGSGKTTTLMRAAYEVARRGHTVYFFKGATALDVDAVLAIARELSSQGAFLFIDRAAQHFDAISGIATKVSDEVKLVMVLANRSHTVFHRVHRLDHLSPVQVTVPELDRGDTELILDKLAATGFLGVLHGRPRREQIAEFLVRAKKQLLVALREATSGKGFDAILAGEFGSLEGEQAKLAYTVTCLAVMHGAPGVRRRQLLACLNGGDEAKVRVLQNSLREVVIPAYVGSDLLAPRHRVIGHYIAAETAPHDLRREALERFLVAVSQDITLERIKKRAPEYLAYRGLINFDGLAELFGMDYDTLVEVYETLQPHYTNDFLFWLQYGRMELEFNHFDLAEKNLAQSLAIRPDSYQTINHQGVLLLKRSNTLPFGKERLRDATEGERILLQQISERGKEDSYPSTAYLHHKLEFVKRRVTQRKRERLEELRVIAKQSIKSHPFDIRLKEVVDRLEREYLLLAVKKRVGRKGQDSRKPIPESGVPDEA